MATTMHSAECLLATFERICDERGIATLREENPEYRGIALKGPLHPYRQEKVALLPDESGDLCWWIVWKGDRRSRIGDGAEVERVVDFIRKLLLALPPS